MVLPNAPEIDCREKQQEVNDMNYANPYVPNQQQPYKLKVPVIVLSFLALAIGLVRFIVDILYYFDIKDYLEPAAFAVTISILVVYMIPFLVWLVHSLVANNRSKGAPLAGIALLFVALGTILAYVESYAWGEGFPDFFIFAYVTDVLTLLTFIPVAIFACIGLSKKAVLIIPALVGLVTESVFLVLYLKDLGWLLDEGWYSNWDLLAWACQNLAPIFMYLAIILYAAANNSASKASPAQSYTQYAPQYVPQNAHQYVPQYAPQYVPQNAPQHTPQYVPQGVPQQMTPDAELRLIYSQRLQGIITEEEYQARRAKILPYLR